MRFDPKSEREFREAMCWPAGEYDFEVTGAESATSKKSGNDMTVLNLKVFNAQGAAKVMKDWLVSSDALGCQMKIYQFCHATGMEQAYQDGTLEAFSCSGLSGRLKLGIEEREGQPPSNTVKSYVVPKPDAEPATTPADPLPAMPSGPQQKAAKEALMPDDASIPF